jgi:hypothetical protein
VPIWCCSGNAVGTNLKQHLGTADLIPCFK